MRFQRGGTKTATFCSEHPGVPGCAEGNPEQQRLSLATSLTAFPVQILVLLNYLNAPGILNSGHSDGKARLN